jgi:hypothetical protein
MYQHHWQLFAGDGITCEVMVTVNPPRNVILSQESSSSLQVTWDHPCDGPPAIHYLITYICIQLGAAFSTNKEQSLSVPRENTSTIIENFPLTVGNIYIVVVTSVFNNVSTASEQVSIHIHVPKCSCPPVITDIVEESDTNINITWTHPCDKPPTTRYIVTTQLISTGLFFTTQPASHVRLPPESTSTTISDIAQVAGNTYIFVVTAVSGDVSQSSQPAQFKIPNPSIIPPPTDVFVTKLTSTSARVNWTPPQGVTPVLYFIYFIPIETNRATPQLLGFAQRTEISYTENRLMEGTTYIILVIARGATTSAADPLIFTSG